MDDEDDWQLVRGKKEKQNKAEKRQDRNTPHRMINLNNRNPRLPSDGRTFESRRPRDTAMFQPTIELSDDEEDDYDEEDKILECPLVWHKFALISNVRSEIHRLLMKYDIFPSTEVGKLSFLGKNIYKNTWHWRNAVECEDHLKRYSLGCNRRFVFISIIPNFTPREYGDGMKLYFVHVRFDQYFLAEQKPKIVYAIDMHNYFGFFDKPTNVPISGEVDYKSNFMRIMKIVEGKMQHDKFQLGEIGELSRSDKKIYYDPLTKKDLTKYKNSIFKCKLYLEDSYSGYGVILDEKYLERKIYLYNRRNCFQAFNHDIVNILVFQLQNEKKIKDDKKRKVQPSDEKSIWSGRVISVEESEVKPVNKIFLCKLTFGQANFMIPICNTIPVIEVDNHLAISRVKKECSNLVEGLKDVNGIENLIQRQVQPQFCNQFANKNFVSLKVLNDKLETLDDRIQFVDSFRCEFIFLVLYKKWSSDFRFPTGDVVGLYAPDSSFSKTLPLIAVSCDLSVVSIEEETELKPEMTKIKIQTIKRRQKTNDNLTKTERKVFSLKFPNQQFNEIAYSFERLDPNTFRLGIHIVNVEKYVKRGSFLDKFAMKQFFTYLLPVDQRPGGDTRPSYLFSEALTKEILSINKTRPVSVVSFYFLVQGENFDIVRQPPIIFEEIVLTDEFDVNIVDEMISGNSIPFGYLTYIYQTCYNNRIIRNRSHVIPPSWFYPDFTLRMDKSAFIISEEMECLVNEFALTELLKIDNTCFPVKVKKNVYHEENLRLWASEINGKMCLKFFPTLKSAWDFPRSSVNTFRFSRQFLDSILINEINLFKCDMLFPDVSFNFYKLENIIAWDAVVPLFDTDPLSSIAVSITKPLSCFSDLLVQRILISGSDYTDDDINNICTEYKINKLIFDTYWEICRGYEIKEKFKDVSFVLDCVFDDVTEDSLLFHHPFITNVHHDGFIPFECLGLNKVKLDSGNEDDYTEFEWLTRIFIYGIEETSEFIDDFQLSDIYMLETRLWRPNLNTTEIIPTDHAKINNLIEENKYAENLTSETSRYLDTKICLPFKLTKGQILRIQFNYNYTTGIMKITPELLIVNPHLRVCLGHRHDPFKYFIHPSQLSAINYRRFSNLEEYKYQFRILNNIEGIHQTISDRTSYFIHDVKIAWIGVKNDESPDDIYGLVVLDHSWCRERLIKLGYQKMKIQDPVNILKRTIEKNKMDFIVCIQSYVKEKKSFWLGHAQVPDVAFIGEKNQKQILLILKLVHSSFPIEPNIDQNYSIEIMEIPITAKVLDRSLRKLQDETLIQRIVMKNISEDPHSGHVRMDYDAVIKSRMVNPYQLNKAQSRALNIAINREFSLIWGPPGTGKTMVGCIIAFAFTQINKGEFGECEGSSSVLYCGPSNQSVDVVAEKLMKTFGQSCPKLLRIFSSDIMNVDFPYPGAIVNKETAKTPDFFKQIALHHIIRNPGKPFLQKLETYDAYFKANTYRGAVNRKDYAKVVEKYQNTVKKAYQKEVEDGKYEIILCTTVGSCRKLLESACIKQVIVDEAAMCSEPENIGPLISRSHLINTVFIGDHMQLRPIITSMAAKGKQLGVSLFERIYNPNKGSYCTMLDQQYRMHPSICEFPSTYFYKDDNAKLFTALSENWSGIPNNCIRNPTLFNGLQYFGLNGKYQAHLTTNDINIADDIWKGIRKMNFKCYPFNLDFTTKIPIKEKVLFVNVEGHELNQAVSGASGSVKSKGNELEVMAVDILYRRLIRKINNRATASHSILVITQYRLQESLLRRRCTNILEELNIPGIPRVSTVIKSQGSECDYVIFSTVRSLPHKKDIDINPSPGWIAKYLGFITDKNQFNVAITRAKKGLFIIGNRELLSVNQHWKALIDDLQHRGCIAETIFDI